MPGVLCRRNPGGWRASLSHLGSLLPLIFSLIVAGGHGAGASVHPCKCRRAKGPMVTSAWLHALALLCQPRWGFLEPSPQHRAPPSPGRDGAALLSTWQVVAPQGYLLPCLPPHPQLEESPCSPLSVACSPRNSSRPAEGCDKDRGLHRHQHCGTQRHFAACACFPVLTPPTPLWFRAQGAGSGALPHLLPLQSPMPAVSPSLPAPQDPSKVTPQQCSIRWKEKSPMMSHSPACWGCTERCPCVWRSSGCPRCASTQRIIGAGSPHSPPSPASTSRTR